MPETDLAENSNAALERIRALLRDYAGEHPGEKRLPTERALSESFGVSRRAVRRALEVLEAEGLVWRRQGSGTYAGREPARDSVAMGDLVSGTDPLEVMEVRLRLEPQLAQLAALRARPDDIRQMRAILSRLTELHDADARELFDGSLHRLIAKSAGNGLFLSLFDILNRVRQDEAWRIVRERARTMANSRSRTSDQHKAIIDAIEARDPERAGRAMRDHLLLIQENLIRQTSTDLLPDGAPEPLAAPDVAPAMIPAKTEPA